MLAFLASTRTEARLGRRRLLLLLLALLVALVVAFFMPIGATARRERALASADIQRLATALTRFYVDLRRFPACSGDDCSRVAGAGRAANNSLAFLAVGDRRGDLSRWYPRESPSLVVRWRLAAHEGPETPERNNAYYHLATNDPNADGIRDRRDYPRDSYLAWNGPYVTQLGLDPWGKTYIVSVGAMETTGRPVAPGAKGWILSAGPNGVLETAPDASVLGGDDIGMLVDGASPGEP